jgi:hypothetical protein
VNKGPSWACPTVIVLSVAAAGLARWIPIGDPGRPFVDGWFLLICPGLAVVPLLRVDDWLIESSLIVVVSLALDALMPTVLLMSGLWSPTWALLGLMSVSLAGAAVQVGGARQVRQPTTTSTVDVKTTQTHSRA